MRPETIRATFWAEDDGTRFAFVGKDKGPVIPPNQEPLIGARSVHAYDSLSSKDYQRHIVSLGGEVRVYGRHSRLLDADRPTAKPAFSFTGIGLVLSKHALPDRGLRQTSKVAGLRLYQPMRQPILYAQLTRYEHVADDRYVVPGYLHDNPSLPVRRIVHQDDFQRFKLTASAERTLLFVSQQYHPMWRVYSDTGPLAVVKVNDFYLGVIVPSGIRWVEFEFRPYVFWSFIPQILYGLVGGGLLLCWILARRKRARTRAR